MLQGPKPGTRESGAKVTGGARVTMQISLGGPNWPWSEIVLNLQCFVCANNFYSVAVKCSLFLSSVKIVATNDSDSSHLITAYYSFIDPERMKG